MLSLLYFFVRLAQSKGAMALEPHIEKPEESAAFAKFPKIAKDHHAVVLICDYLRMVGMNADDPHQIEDVMARELKKVLARSCTRATPCSRWRTRCPRSASSPPCSASSRPWRASTSRRPCSAR
jgi:flagellar motor component MotA